MFLHVVEARSVRDYTVWLRFSDGAAGEVDLDDELEGPVFGPLRDIERFKRFSVACHTLTWDNGADFAPDFFREQVAVTVQQGAASDGQNQAAPERQSRWPAFLTTWRREVRERRVSTRRAPLGDPHSIKTRT